MEEEKISIRNEALISFALNSFFCLAMILYGISSLIGGNISPLAIGSLILGIFQLIIIRNIFENIRQKEIVRANSNFNLIGTVNIIISLILYLLVLASLIFQYMLDPSIGLDILILYAFYYTALFLGLGFTSGLYSLMTSRKSLTETV